MRNGSRNGIHRSHGGGHGHGGSQPSVEILSQMGFETRDVSIPNLIKWGAVLVGFIVVSTVGSRILYKFIVPTYADELNQPMRHQRRVPPFPQVQPFPKKDMMAYRTAEDRVLEGQAAMPGDKPGMSIDAAIDSLATQKGIAGKTGAQVNTFDANSKAYPGGGEYKDVVVPTSSTGPAPVTAQSDMNSATAPEPIAPTTGSGIDSTSAPSPAAPTPGAVRSSTVAPSPAAGVTP